MVRTPAERNRRAPQPAWHDSSSRPGSLTVGIPSLFLTGIGSVDPASEDKRTGTPQKIRSAVQHMLQKPPSMVLHRRRSAALGIEWENR